MHPTIPRRLFRIFTLLLPVWLACLGSAAGATPQLSITKAAGSDVTVSWPSQIGASYQLQSNISLGTWVDKGGAVPGTGGTLSVTVSITGISRTFFRLKPPPPDVITAAFVSGTGILTITGGDQDNAITVSRNAGGSLLVNGGAVSITGGTPTVANTIRIDVFGREGDDQLAFNESQGPLPPARLFGEGGQDVLTGGSGADLLDGGTGNDTLLGKGGVDNLLGGDEGDILIGGDGNDLVSGGNDNDHLIWNPGDDSDLNEGDDGSDTIQVNGGNGNEIFSTVPNGTRVRFERIDPAPFSLDIGSAENLILNANGGDDDFSATGNLAALIKITVDGGAGADSLSGGNGIDLLIGGDGNDFIDGQQNNDLILMGAGDDLCQWDPGDGSDIVEGQDGSDSLRFNGSAGNEIFEVSANGDRVLLTRNLGSISMSLDDIESLELKPLAGADIFTVNNLGGTDLTTVTADLAVNGVGDSAVDTVVIYGTAIGDAISLTANAPNVTVTGLSATVRILQPEVLNDDVVIHGLGGTDIFSVGAGVTGLIGVTTNQ